MLTREQLLSKRTEILSVIEECNKKEFDYCVCRPFMQFGEICEMTNENLVYAFAKLKEATSNIDSAAAELGVVMEPGNADTIQGYTFEEWKKDFMTRIEENKNTEKIRKMNQALDIINENLSADDKFALAMDNLASLIGE